MVPPPLPLNGKLSSIDGAYKWNFFFFLKRRLFKDSYEDSDESVQVAVILEEEKLGSGISNFFKFFQINLGKGSRFLRCMLGGYKSRWGLVVMPYQLSFMNTITTGVRNLSSVPDK